MGCLHEMCGVGKPRGGKLPGRRHRQSDSPMGSWISALPAAPLFFIVACFPTAPLAPDASRQAYTDPSVVTDPEDPKFDLEKLVESWAAKA